MTVCQARAVTMATREEVVQLESGMETEDYRKLQGLFTVGSV